EGNPGDGDWSPGSKSWLRLRRLQAALGGDVPDRRILLQQAHELADLPAQLGRRQAAAVEISHEQHLPRRPAVAEVADARLLRRVKQVQEPVLRYHLALAELLGSHGDPHLAAGRADVEDQRELPAVQRDRQGQVFVALAVDAHLRLEATLA